MNHDDDDDDADDDDDEEYNKKVKNHNQKQGPGTLPEDAKHVDFGAHFFFKTFVVPGQRVCQSDTSRPEWKTGIISSIQIFFLEASKVEKL